MVVAMLSSCSLLPPDGVDRVADRSVESGSKAEAQKRLDAAAKRMEKEATAAFKVTLTSAPYSTSGELDFAAELADYTLKVQVGDVTTRVRTRLVGGESYVRFSTNDPQGSAFKNCWVHYTTTSAADPLPLPYAAYLVKDPKATGVLEEDDSVVMARVRTVDALGAALPKLVGLLPDDLDATRIPALVTLKNHAVASIVFDLVDIKSALAKQKVDLEKLAKKQSKKSSGAFLDEASVTVRFSAIGKRLDITRPAPVETMEMDAAKPDATPRLCASAR